MRPHISEKKKKKTPENLKTSVCLKFGKGLITLFLSQKIREKNEKNAYWVLEILTSKAETRFFRFILTATKKKLSIILKKKKKILLGMH